MNYEDLFIIWHDMNEDADFGSIDKASELIGKAVAFTSLSYLNFSYSITGTLVEDKPVNITTTTEYDIGPITDLWIIDDDKDYTEGIQGEFYNVNWSPRNISRYDNATKIEDRLDGDENHLGFGLAVTNYARIAVIAATVAEQDDSEILDDNNEIVDGTTADYNVTRLDLRTGNKPSFGIDFASKPNYTLGGDEDNQMVAPVKLYPSVRLKANAVNVIDGLAVWFLNSINKAMIQWRLDYANERYNLEGKKIEITVAKRNIFYAICFPEWSGKSIYQDPTFTAYADPSKFIRELIGGYAPFLIGVLFVITTSLIVIRKYKKNN